MRPWVPEFTVAAAQFLYLDDEDVQQGLKQHRAGEARAEAGAGEPSPRYTKMIRG
jgi:hypothetical protein